MRRLVLSAALAALPALAAAAGPVANWTLRFDWLTPPGVTCAGDAPAGTVRASRSLLGNPIVTVHGDLDGASVTCVTPDGAHWRTALPRDSRAPLSVNVEALAAWRPGAARMTLYITGEDRFDTPQVHRFTRLD